MSTQNMQKIAIPIVLILAIGGVAFILLNNNSNDSLPNYSLDELFNSKFDDYIETNMEDGVFHDLSMGLVVDDQLVWNKNYGDHAEIEMVYPIASITKTFTAVGFMQLVEAGLIDLDDDVENYLPFPFRSVYYPNDVIKIRHLLSHQSGLGIDLSTYEEMMFRDMYNKHMGWDNEILDFRQVMNEYFGENGTYNNLNTRWGAYQPGKSKDVLRYSSVGFEVLGLILENVTGVTIDQYMLENIINPMGLTKTNYYLDNYTQSELAIPYQWSVSYDDGGFNQDHILPLYELLPEAAGSIRSTVTELSKFLIVLMNDGKVGSSTLLSSSSLEEMKTPTAAYFEPTGRTFNLKYGLGFFSRDFTGSHHQLIMNGHLGNTLGYSGIAMYNSTEDYNFGILLLTNNGEHLGTTGETNYFEDMVNALIDRAYAYVTGGEPPKLVYSSALMLNSANVNQLMTITPSKAVSDPHKRN